MGRALTFAVDITSKLGVRQRIALEQLLFFNVNQHRVRGGIQQSIETYGVPEIYEQDGELKVRVGDISGVETLFAVSAEGRPMGVVVFIRSDHARFAVLHLGIEPHLSIMRDSSTRVLLRLMHEMRGSSRREHRNGHIEFVYKDRHAARLHG
jgi:hypothetical protein